jgi:hypothetical protein
MQILMKNEKIIILFMKKNTLLLILLVLCLNSSFAQLSAIFLDSILIRVNYEKINDSILKIDYSIFNTSNSSIFIRGVLDEGLVNIEGDIFELSNGEYDFTIGYNDPTFDLISKKPLYLLEISSLKKWVSDKPLFINSLSSIKMLNFYYILEEDYKSIAIKNKNYKMVSVKKYQLRRKFLKLAFM